MSGVFQLSDVTVNFEGIRALDGLTLEIREGAITGLIGPNGAGKTTAFNVMTGFVVPDQGQVILGSRVITGMDSFRVTRLGVVRTFQDLRLFPTLTVVEHITMAIPRKNVENPFRTLWPWTYPPSERRRDRERARELLEYVGLGAIDDNRLASQLSYGQQKMLCIARALATEANILLLDEPTSGLAPALVAQNLQLLRRLQADGRTICLVEHNIEAIADISDVLIVLDRGKKVSEGDPHSVLADPVVLRVYLGE